MSKAYLNLIGGLSGDMLLSSLFDAGLDHKLLHSELKKLNFIDFEFSISKTFRHNIEATHTDVIVKDQKKWTWSDFYHVVNDSNLNITIKNNVINCFDLLRNAEEEFHKEKNPHLHELGTSDTLVDICGFFIAMDILRIEKLFSSPIPVVPGSIKTSHGSHNTLAPATKNIVEKLNIPMRYMNHSSNIETITPTGISIIGSFAVFRNSVDIRPTKTGSGAGSKTFENFPNVITTIIDEDIRDSLSKDTKALLETNIDDMSPELLGRFVEHSISLGALDTWITPYYGKKNRLGHKLTLLCNIEDTEKFSNLIIDETSSLGVRLSKIDRLEANRKIMLFDSSFGKINIKMKYIDNELHSVKPEFEDINKISKDTGKSLLSISKLIEYEINKEFFS